jgi:hypothetical protein
MMPLHRGRRDDPLAAEESSADTRLMLLPIGPNPNMDASTF